MNLNHGVELNPAINRYIKGMPASGDAGMGGHNIPGMATVDAPLSSAIAAKLGVAA